VTLVVVVPAAEFALGQITLPDALVVEGISSGRVSFLQGVGGKIDEHLGREGVVARVKSDEFLKDRPQVVADGQPAQGDGNGRPPSPQSVASGST
jgi:hypothetical protein